MDTVAVVPGVSEQEPRYSYITIGGPISVEVFGRLGKMIGEAWPGAVILYGQGLDGLPAEVLDPPVNFVIRIDRNELVEDEEEWL